MNTYVVTDSHGTYYHIRDTAKTGRLFCGLQYIMGRDTFTNHPPAGREPCPECSRVLRERAQGVIRPQIIIDDEQVT